MGPVVVIDRVSIEEFAGIVGIVAGILEPDWQEVVIEPLIHELRIATLLDVSLVKITGSRCGTHRMVG